MQIRQLFLGVLLCIPGALFAQSKVAIVRVTPEAASPRSIDILYNGAVPADRLPYARSDAWRIWWRRTAEADPVSVVVDMSHSDFASRPHVFRIALAGDLPPVEFMTAAIWTVEFNPPNDAKLLPQISEFQPTRTDFASQEPNSPPPASTAHSVSQRPTFAPPHDGAPADISLTGSFLAGGGTKPIYALEFFGAVYRPSPWNRLFKFTPGVTATVAINQNIVAPVDRSTFDPDSITAAFALQRLKRIHHGWLQGLQFDEALPSGEFDRIYPASNLIFRSDVLFATTPWVPQTKVPIYGILYPVFALEAGHNLNKPRSLAGAPVDLSGYNGILRGVGGVETKLAVATADRSSDSLALSASYRVRIPAFDEPYVQTLHQVTTAALTTKARHWVEADLSYSPPGFRYLSIDAKYQYGDLPPVFLRVDHSFTFGFTFQAVQSNKPGVLGVIR